jgi:peptidyl-prolyl cis-trans isomerase C
MSVWGTFDLGVGGLSISCVECTAFFTVCAVGEIRQKIFLIIHSKGNLMFSADYKFQFSRIAAAVSLSLCAATAAQAQTVATVNGVPVSQQRIDAIAAQSGRAATPEVTKEIVENLAYTIIAYQEALKGGLEKTDEAIAQLDSAKQSVLARIYVEKYIKTIQISDAELQAEFNKMNTGNEGKQYKARHILVEKEGDAKKIIAQLKKDPKAFSALAKAKSTDKGSAINGGDLGFFDPQSMVPEFSAAVMQLQKGKFTTTPVKSQFGYHVIVLDDVRSAPPVTLDQVKPQLQQQMRQEALRAYFDQLKSQAKIEITQSPAVSPMPAEVATPSTPKP